MFRTIRRIISWCGEYRKRLYVGFVFTFLSHWFTVLPLMIAAMMLGKLIAFTKGVGTFTTSDIWWSFGLLGGAVLLRFFFDYMRARFQEAIGFELVARDRLQVGDALKRVSLGYFQNMNTGNILSSITTGMTMLEGMGIRMLDTFIGGYLCYLAIFLTFLVVNPMSALISLGAALVSFCGLLLLSRNSVTKAPIAAKADRDLTGATLEYARGLSVVKSFGQSGEASRAMEDAVRDSRDIHLRMEWGFIPPHCLHLAALKVGSILIAISVMLTYLSGGMDISMMLMLLFLSLSVFGSLEPLSDSAHVLGVIDDAMDQVDALGSENYIDENGKDIKLDNYDIEFRNVDFGYEKERKILKDVSFRIPEYTSTAIVGPSGSGKTTLINLIARFYDVNSGSITVGGHDVREFTCDSLLSNISMVFQNVYLFNDTVKANIRFGRPDATDDEIIEAAKKACCHDFIMGLPKGYDTVVGEGGGTLSGGEKQRISIARAILKDSPIIILDEATASVDPENEHLIQNAITELTKGKTIITIAHRLATIESSDQILVVDDGRIVEAGNHEDLIKEDGIYRSFMERRKVAEGWSIE